MKKRIIVSGYPKSGNTWLTRLVAELVKCPVAGFWCQPFHKEIAIEGHERISSYQCFKAHLAYEDLQKTLTLYGNKTEKIIYIYRDPRAVVVSGGHYFNHEIQKPFWHNVLSKIPKGLSIYYKYVHNKEPNFDLIIKWLLEGTTEKSWLQKSWEMHVMSYKDISQVLLVKYEDLKSTPISEAKRILHFLGLEKTDEIIDKAIFAQEFEQRKKQFATEGKKNEFLFMRKGRIDSWKDELTRPQIQILEKHLAQTMLALGYKLSSNC